MYNKKVVEHLEKNCFYKNNEILLRNSDQYIIDFFKENSFDSILDYGCGSGRMYDLLKRAGVNLENYVGYDSSKDMLAYAAEKFPKANFIKEPEGLYNIVLCSGVLQHQKPGQLKEFITTVLKFGDRVLFQFWYANKEKFKFAEIENTLIPEYFPTKDIIENDLFNDSKILEIKYFQDNPYDLCVLLIEGKPEYNIKSEKAVIPAEKKTTAKKAAKKPTTKKATKEK